MSKATFKEAIGPRTHVAYDAVENSGPDYIECTAQRYEVPRVTPLTGLAIMEEAENPPPSHLWQIAIGQFRWNNITDEDFQKLEWLD